MSQKATREQPLRPSDGRVPPNDLDAEAAVLSAIMLDPSVLDRALPVVSPEHFYSDANRHIYEAQIGLRSSGKPLDILTLKGWLADHDMLARVGGVQYLAQIQDAVPAIANVDAYTATVREKWRLRQLIATCQRISAEGYAPIDDAQTFIDAAEQGIYEIARSPESSKTQSLKTVIVSAFTQLTEAYKRGSKIVGVSTGFERLDWVTGGLHVGDLVIVAARPGMGKTALVLDVSVNVASPRQMGVVDGVAQIEPGKGVAVFSLEMPREQVALRMLCSEARVDVSKLRTGGLTKEDWDRLTVASATLAKLPITIDDTSSISLLELRAKVRRIQAQAAAGECPPLGLVVIDYLQLMTGNPKASNREQQVSELSRGFKLLAKDLGVPVIVLSQLNRSVETRGKDKRPQLSDLRESGAIEQDADTVVFIFRDDYYEKDNPEVAGLAELIVAKQRNGPTGAVKVRFSKYCTRFDNLAGEEYDDLPSGQSQGRTGSTSAAYRGGADA